MPFNSLTNYGDVTREEIQVFLNSNQLAGIQNVNLSYDHNSQETKYLGMNKCLKLPSGPQIGSFNINYSIISDELVLPFTGVAGCNGYILKARNNRLENFSFSSGYLSSYSMRASIGEIPQANANFAVYGDVGALGFNETTQINSDLTNILASDATGLFKPTSYNTISLNLDSYSTNRIISTDLNISVQRNPIYYLGSRYPVAVNYNPPIVVDLNFTLEKSDYISQKLQFYPFLEKKNNLSIGLRNFNLNTPVVNYAFDNMILKSESYGATSDGRATYQLGFRNYFV